MSKKSTRSQARQSPKKVRMSNTGKGLTSQAGLLPVVKFLNKFGFTGLVQETIRHERKGKNAVYELVDGILFTVIGLIGGATSMLGVVAVCSDGVLAQLAGWIRIPDDSTLGRLFKTVKEVHIVQMETLVHRLRARVWRGALRAGVCSIGASSCLCLDGDSTVKTVYGKPEGAEKGYNPQKRGARSYHPLVVFCSSTKEIMQGWFRCGSAYTSNGIIEFMKQLLAHLPNRTHLFFRADSGFFAGPFLTWLECQGHSYLIKVKLKGLTRLLAAQTWTKIKGQAGWEQCVFWYQCTGWIQERRFLAVRRLKQDPQTQQWSYDYFCYVTSEELTPWQAHKLYGKRATCETWLDEAKNQMGLAHLKTADFLANAALFQCAIVAYNTVRWMALYSGDAVLRRWEVGTVRAFLVRVAGKLVSGARQYTLKTPDNHLFMDQWLAWVKVGLT